MKLVESGWRLASGGLCLEIFKEKEFLGPKEGHKASASLVCDPNRCVLESVDDVFFEERNQIVVDQERVVESVVQGELAGGLKIFENIRAADETELDQ